MVYYLLAETLGFSYGVEETEELVPKGAVTFADEAELEKAVAQAELDVVAELEAFEKEANEGIEDEPVKEEEGLELNALEQEILDSFKQGLDHDTIKKKFKVVDIRNVARKLGVEKPGQLKENELCEAIDAKLKEG